MFKFVLSGQGRLWINWMKRQFRRTRLLVVVSRRQLRGMLLLRGNRILLINIIKGWRFLLVKLGYEWIFFFFYNCCWVLWGERGGGILKRNKEIKIMLLCRIIRWEFVLIFFFILQGVEFGFLEIIINSLQKFIEVR